MVFPIVFYQEIIEDDEEDMGDAEYFARIAAGELTSGVLKSFQNEAGTTAVIGTVPTGKDWYLMGWDIFQANSNATMSLEYPTGTVRDSSKNTTTTTNWYFGVVKGFKATTGQTITIARSAAITNMANLFILEVDTGVSPQLT